MSTEFRTTTTDEWVGTRWSGGRERGTCFDVGNVSRCMDLLEGKYGDTFDGDDGSTIMLNDVRRFFDTGRVTFGEFCGTVSLGSGECLDRLPEV